MAVLDSLRMKATLVPGTLADREVVLRHFARFAERMGLQDANEVTQAEARDFVEALREDGSAPSVADSHRRRAALRLLYAEGRFLELVTSDPARDLWLPPRSPLRARPLEDDEIELGRAWAVTSRNSLRRSLAWGLAEAGAWTTEITAALIEHVDLAGGRVWLIGTPTKDARWAHLTHWGGAQLELRMRRVKATDGRAALIDWRSRPRPGHAAGAQAIKETLRASGLDREADVRPRSIVGWRGRSLLREGHRIDEVARALGYRSLDEAASFLGFDWRGPGRP
jgi:integrase/recombinase XerC